MELKLPLDIVTPTDVNRILRELEKLDDFFITASAHGQQASTKEPAISELLGRLAKDNGHNLLEAGGRKKLAEQLKEVKDKTPMLHISFAAEPSPSALEKILVWFRANVHPQALLQVGLQPSIAAGCVLRTPNKIFDLSLKSHLDAQVPYLAKLIDGVAHGQRQQ